MIRATRAGGRQVGVPQRHRADLPRSPGAYCRLRCLWHVTDAGRAASGETGVRPWLFSGAHIGVAAMCRDTMCSGVAPNRLSGAFTVR